MSAHPSGSEKQKGGLRIPAAQQVLSDFRAHLGRTADPHSGEVIGGGLGNNTIGEVVPRELDLAVQGFEGLLVLADPQDHFEV
jgi:hypothetical protein